MFQRIREEAASHPGADGTYFRSNGTYGEWVDAPIPDFDVRDFYEDTDGSDWLPAARRAVAAAEANGAGEVVFAGQSFPFESSTNTAGIVWQLVVAGDDISIRCKDGGKITSAVTDARVLFAYGSAKPAGMASWNTNEYGDATSYALTGTATKGRRTVTTTTAAHAGNFAAGDLAYVFTGQTIGGAATGQPRSEINRVRSVNAGTGVVTFDWPLARTYVAENYRSGSTGRSIAGGGGTAAPYAIAKVTDRTLRNFALVDPVIECGSGPLQAVSVWGVLGFRWTGGRLLVPENGFGARDVRHAECSGFEVERVDNGDRAYLFGPSTGCTHWNVHDFALISDGDGYLHIHEDVAQARFHHFTVVNAEHDGQDPMIDVRGGATDVSVTDWETIVENASAANVVFVEDSVTPDPSTGRLERGRVTAGNADANVIVNTAGFRVKDVDTTTGRVSQRGTLLGQIHETEMIPFSGVVTFAKQTVTATRKLPRHSAIKEAFVYVSTAFDSSGTDLLDIGYTGNTTAYATGIDVSTTGFKTVTITAVPEHTADRELVLTYTNGGTEPTVGSVDVYGTIQRLERRD